MEIKRYSISWDCPRCYCKHGGAEAMPIATCDLRGASSMNGYAIPDEGQPSEVEMLCTDCYMDTRKATWECERAAAEFARKIGRRVWARTVRDKLAFWKAKR